MNVAVIGANGQLGADLCALLRQAGVSIVEVNHGAVDITEPQAVLDVLAASRIDAVINTAAFHHVDKCEADPKTAFAVNALGARNVALAAKAVNCYLIHVSTDYVFDGNKKMQYVEDDLPCPLNVYANTKLAGEYFVRTLWVRSLVMRTSGLYGKHPCRGKGLNFVDLMLKLAKERDQIRVVDHEILTPTSTIALARQIVRLVQTPLYGLCHATCEGACSWYQFAREIFSIKGMTVNLQVAGPNEFPVKVPRPFYSVLENAVLKKAGLNTFCSWQDALREYLAS